MDDYKWVEAALLDLRQLVAENEARWDAEARQIVADADRSLAALSDLLKSQDGR